MGGPGLAFETWISPTELESDFKAGFQGMERGMLFCLLPAPLNAVTRSLKSGASSEITVSSKAIPATFIANQGRNDQEE